MHKTRSRSPNKHSEKVSSTPQKPHEEPVFLNVYDLLRLNDFTKTVGLGVYHTGIEVYGVEYGFTGRSSSRSGIFEMTPRNDAELNESCYFNRSILLGATQLTPAQVKEVISQLGRCYRGQYYHLTNFNCNHFSNALAEFLCGQGIPSWVNRVANIITHVPILNHLLPKDVINTRNHGRKASVQLTRPS
ncbi:desumoylating isopeptidase 2 [Ceratitis capitata]|uniref:(Mediterranean fruit fly) hypothetical protein n=1 Tax=Ceratitis capitata TaxID=7213 RepID=W8C439_CERCA|nr:desumoylating isopeptidase 2 [Ceratitis capitata]CAD6991694.1 unnamed protein product [Ceratitis capitata]